MFFYFQEQKSKVHGDTCAVSIFYVIGALVLQGDGEGCRDTMYRNFPDTEVSLLASRNYALDLCVCSIVYKL